ncbi:hypothetical protein FF38_01013 [Lucilia cuprina]|uniref:Uncharacterized protein n=1 Tax=Lucilia cuprina TaxID=7375 RepID=A0A0L0BV49_LUCCU|nr:hypothetical protein FF38_01013 [Lucilia cuprina]
MTGWSYLQSRLPKIARTKNSHSEYRGGKTQSTAFMITVSPTPSLSWGTTLALSQLFLKRVQACVCCLAFDSFASRSHWYVVYILSTLTSYFRITSTDELASNGAIRGGDEIDAFTDVSVKPPVLNRGQFGLYAMLPDKSAGISHNGILYYGNHARRMGLEYKDYFRSCNNEEESVIAHHSM